jgi:hypothetical protein
MSITQHQEGHRPSAAGVLEAAGEGHRIRIAPRLEAPHCLLKQNHFFLKANTYAIEDSQNAQPRKSVCLLKL